LPSLSLEARQQPAVTPVVLLVCSAVLLVLLVSAVPLLSLALLAARHPEPVVPQLLPVEPVPLAMLSAVPRLSLPVPVKEPVPVLSLQSSAVPAVPALPVTVVYLKSSAAHRLLPTAPAARCRQPAVPVPVPVLVVR